MKPPVDPPGIFVIRIAKSLCKGTLTNAEYDEYLALEWKRWRSWKAFWKTPICNRRTDNG